MMSFRVGVLQVAHAFLPIAQVADAGTRCNRTATTATPSATVDGVARLSVRHQLLPLPLLLLAVMTMTMIVRQRGVDWAPDSIAKREEGAHEIKVVRTRRSVPAASSNLIGTSLFPCTLCPT